MPRIDIVDFPGRDHPDGINLLTYPWLYHELGHLILARRGAEFGKSVGKIVDDVNRQVQRGSLGKARAVQDRLQQIQEKISRAWRPSPNHTDWSHEIATDIVALWSCGPAFLAAYDDSVEGKEAHVIDDVHPPYEIRTAAMIEAAKRLGWSNYIASLSARLERWMQESAGVRNDVFLALRSDELINGVLTAGLGICSTLGLPRCDSECISQVENLLEQNLTPSFGRPLILASWIQYGRLHADIPRYHDWERTSVDTLVREVTPTDQ